MDMTSAVSSPTKTCSLKREITYNDSDAEEGNKKYASELVKSIYVRDGKKDENEPALSVYTLEYDGDGNITKHTYSKPGIAIGLGTVTSSTYEYDKLNRLTRENNERLGARILKVMSAEDRGKILGAMNSEVAAKITKIMDPES